jgi:Uma2 family endonuclease
MRTPSEILAAVDHLPPAAVLALDNITWEEYEQITEDFEERPNIRVTYDQGKLEIVTTSRLHEFWKVMIAGMARIVCEEARLNMEEYGGATWQKEELLKAVEADTCFYVSNPGIVIGKDEIDISVDPPPDVMVEVDKANQSLNKFSIYAAFGVPEIWRCDVRRNRIQMLELRGSVYVEIPSSRAFPVLTGAILVDLIARSRTDGQMAALSAFRHWIQSVKSV